MSEAGRNHPVAKAISPIVSIGLPVYNGEKYIREALDSLLTQTFADFELIISDNASTDATKEICQMYAANDSRIRFARQPENRGALANFKFVLDEARGEYFMWAAADDIWDSRWLSGMLLTMKNTGSRAAFGKIQCIDEHSEELKHYANNITFDYRGSPLVRQLKYFLQFEGAGKANPIYALWKTGDLRELNLNKYQYDYLIVFDLLKNADMAGCSDSILYKRIHSDCEGGRVTGVPTKRGLVKTLRLVWAHMTHPLPGDLISEYLRSSGRKKALYILVLPIKYLFAYWFFISNRRFSFRKAV